MVSGADAVPAGRSFFAADAPRLSLCHGRGGGGDDALHAGDVLVLFLVFGFAWSGFV